MKAHNSAIHWFRRDLRINDNPALTYAYENSQSVTMVYLHCPSEEHPWEPGAASNWWLHQTLLTLSKKLEALGGRLIFRIGVNPQKELEKLALEVQADLITWNRLYDPALITRDKKIKTFFKESFSKNGIQCETFNGSLLKEPWEIKTTTGGPYQVFTPFWRKLEKEYSDSSNSETLTKRRKIKAITNKPLAVGSEKLENLQLLPKIPWDKNFYTTWEVGEDAALKKLTQFLNTKVKTYKIERDFPSANGSSILSPHLHFGEISPDIIWRECKSRSINKNHIEPFLRQLGWRDFAHHLLYHFPKTPTEPLKKDFERFPWSKDKKLLKKWQSGQTGFPIIDAGMRELWATGTMHNRVRMIVGSILVKNFLIHWEEGARWFWDCLLDADLANNTLGWQWIAGCGADAAPYFRIFNPVSQSERFDAGGSYIRKWLPELSSLPDKWIHKPWEAPEQVLFEAKVKLNKTYPKPAIDLKESRIAALEAYYSLRGK